MNPSYFQVLFGDESAFSSISRLAGVDCSQAARIDALESENTRLREQLRQQAFLATGLTAAREKAETVSRNKGEFLANVSHEIRTAVSGVIGLANLLHDSLLNDEQRDLVQTMCRSGEGLVTLMNDLLDFSKIEAGCLALEVIDFNVREELQLALELQASQAARKGLKLVMHLDPEVPAALRGDPLRLRQMVLNLMSNAVKFTECGGVVLRMRYEPGEPQGRLRCEITDTGIGIPPAAQAKLFQPFVQADAATSRRFGGTGLGLAICKRLAELMRGEIGVRSAPGVGSVFWFSVEMAEVTSPEASAAVAWLPLAGRSVLIVDPHAGCRNGLADLCTAWEMKCEVADSSEMALIHLRQATQIGTRYDAVMFENRMPGTDGLEFARTIAADSEISGTALVMLTAGAKCPSAHELEACGITACESKPVRPEKLRHTLGRALANRRAD
ncbi:ATP-binding protein [Oleiharenicola lentus]|uniref:ATP-binding protein n=1 Tax=Oleiharenicola lentus TaxID=2508720 RepID=UPI003F680C51